MSSASVNYNLGGQLVRNYDDKKRVNKGLGLLYTALDEWIASDETHKAAFAAFFITEGLKKTDAPKKNFLTMLAIVGFYLTEHKDSSLVIAWNKLTLKLPDEDRYLMLCNADNMTKQTAAHLARNQIAAYQKPLYQLQAGTIEPYQLEAKYFLDGQVEHNSLATKDITTTDEHGTKQTHTVTRRKQQSPEGLKRRKPAKEKQNIDFREIALGALFKNTEDHHE